MGQKVHPTGFRLGIIKTWDSKWFATKGYSKLVFEDRKIRDYIKERLFHAGISKIEIERAANKVKIRIHTARPGIVIGKKGAEIEVLRRDHRAPVQAGSPYRYPGSSPSRTRCHPGCGKYSTAARKARGFPPRNEACCQLGPEVWRQGRKGCLGRAAGRS